MLWDIYQVVYKINNKNDTDDNKNAKKHKYIIWIF